MPIRSGLEKIVSAEEPRRSARTLAMGFVRLFVRQSRLPRYPADRSDCRAARRTRQMRETPSPLRELNLRYCDSAMAGRARGSGSPLAALIHVDPRLAEARPSNPRVLLNVKLEITDRSFPTSLPSARYRAKQFLSGANLSMMSPYSL